jgi:hypothetical protein
MATESKLIEQLIEEREQKRADEYWERIERLKVHEEEQKSWHEAHEQKQLEYMRSAGIDLKKFESDQEEDARNLKSYLEQSRPLLISRPKQTPHFQLPTGWHAPLPTVFAPPPDPSKVQPSNSSEIKIKSVQAGGGTGWADGPGDPPHYADVVFNFTPHQDASYTFTAWFAFHGFYILQANDGSFTSKSAEVHLNVFLDAFQFVDRGSKSFTVIDLEDDNVNDAFVAYDQVLGIFSDTQDFREGQPVIVTATIQVEAKAIGSGSHAEVNFEDGDANYIQPLGLWVYPAP